MTKAKSKIVGYKMIPQQVGHIETPQGSTRCTKCWLLNGKPGQHFCRWDIVNDSGRNPNPQLVKKPIFQRIKAA